MKFNEYNLNEFDRVYSTEESLNILKEGLDRTGFFYVIKNVSRYNPAISSYYISLGFEDLGLSVNGKGTTEDIALASLYGEACERIQGGINNSIYIPHLLPYIKYKMYEGKNLRGYRYAHEHSFNKEKFIPINEFLRGVPHTQEHINTIQKADIGRHWVKGYSLLTNEDVLIPHQFISLWNGSNGVSAGVTYEGAILQATSEIFERYALRRAMSGKREWPILPLHIFNQKIKDLTKKVEGQGFKVEYRDFSEGKGYPVIGALIECLSEPVRKASRLYISHGASPNINYAAERCITEYFQGWEPMMVALRQADVLPPTRWPYAQNLYDLDIFSFLGDLRFFQSFVGESTGWETPEMTTTSYLNYFLNIIKKENTDLIVLNLTQDFCKIPTVRVIIPGFSEMANIQHNLQGDEERVLEYMDFTTHGFQVVDNWVNYAKYFKQNF